MGGDPLSPIGGSPPAQAQPADVTIVEPTDRDGAVIVNPGAGQPEFFVQGNSKIEQLNRLTQGVFERNTSLGQFMYELPKDQKYEFTFSGFKEPGAPVYTSESGPISGKILPGGRIALDRPIIRKNADGTTDVVDIIDQEAIFPTQVMVVKGIDAPPPEPQSDPHAALLNPKRKMRLAE